MSVIAAALNILLPINYQEPGCFQELQEKAYGVL